MAFSKELEEFIDAALADGVLTDKERAVLHRRAMLEGVTPDEIDVVIDGRLAKMKREEDWLRPSPPQSDKYGDVVKCPACGAIVTGTTAKCPECGHEFRNIDTNSCAERFAKLLKDNDERNSLANAGSSLLRNWGVSDNLTRSIESFPVPNSTEDLYEMLVLLQPLADRNFKGEKLAMWNLYGKCINKVIGMGLANDNRFAPFVEDYNSRSKKLTRKQKALIGFIAFYAIFFLLYFVYRGTGGADEERKTEVAIQQQCDSLCNLILELPVPTTDNYNECLNKVLNLTWTRVARYYNNYEVNQVQAFINKKNAYILQLNNLHVGDSIPQDSVGKYIESRY